MKYLQRDCFGVVQAQYVYGRGIDELIALDRPIATGVLSNEACAFLLGAGLMPVPDVQQCLSSVHADPAQPVLEASCGPCGVGAETGALGAGAIGTGLVFSVSASVGSEFVEQTINQGFGIQCGWDDGTLGAAAVEGLVLAPLLVVGGNRAANKLFERSIDAGAGAKVDSLLLERQIAKYGKGGHEALDNGRYRFYDELQLAKTPGTMKGQRMVREWDPGTGASSTWFETLDHADRVRQIRPQMGPIKAHYMFDESGAYTGYYLGGW